MNVFVSWSGPRSKAVASALASWLEKVFEGVRAWCSDADIPAGAVWLPELFTQLKQSRFGVVCMTPENIAAPWLLFEAGAVWRGMEQTRVVPYCFKLDPLELGEPLKHLQGVRADADGTLRLLRSLNAAREQPRSDQQLEEAFGVWWPRLEEKLAAIASSPPTQSATLAAFGDQIVGYWWERVHPEESTALSFIRIAPDPATSTVRLHGRAYGSDASLAAHWESVASCINVGERKVFYYWRGFHPKRPSEPFEGYGEISFAETGGPLDTGFGFFSDTNLTDVKSTVKKSFELRRCSAEEARVMEGGDRERITNMVRAKLTEMN